MSSPIDLIREGIKSEDMSIVAEGFKLLTGESVTIDSSSEPEIETNNTAKVSITDFIVSDRSEKKVESNANGRTHSQSLYIGDRKNKFTDDGSISSEDRKGLIDDSITPPVPRTRKKVSKAEVTCNKCNRIYRVSPSLKRDFYVCERCVG